VVIICPSYIDNLKHSTLYLWVLYGSHCKPVISLNNINQLIFVMVKCGVLFEARTEFLNII
jgi:hypothetical protein